MSRTLYFLGFEQAAEGQEPINDEIRLRYGFDTDPVKLFTAAEGIFTSRNPDDMKNGMDVGFAAIDILDGSRKPVFVDKARNDTTPGIVRPMVFSRSQEIMWQGFSKAFSMAAKARKNVNASELPEFDELCSAETNGLMIGALATPGSVRVIRAYSQPNFASANTSAAGYLTRKAAAAVVFDSLPFTAVNPTWTV